MKMNQCIRNIIGTKEKKNKKQSCNKNITVLRFKLQKLNPKSELI